jgi:hypothetical protein
MNVQETGPYVELKPYSNGSYVDLSPEARVNFAFINWLNCGPGLAPYAKLVTGGTDRKIAYEALNAAFVAGNQVKTP